MKINGIKNMRYEEESADVLLDVSFEPDTANLWELVEPEAQIVYTLQTDVEMNYMELLDQGIIVHSFEFSEEEVKEIEDYLEENHIKDKIRQYRYQ